MIALVAAGAVYLSGRDADLRTLLGFQVHPARGTPSDAIEIAAHNGRLGAGLLVAAWAVVRVPSARKLLDVVIGGLLVLNAAAIGLAVGAYGGALLTTLAPHLPLELGAFSLAGSTYVVSRRIPLSERVLAQCTASCAALLVLAATAETYVVVGAR